MRSSPFQKKIARRSKKKRKTTIRKERKVRMTRLGGSERSDVAGAEVGVGYSQKCHRGQASISWLSLELEEAAVACLKRIKTSSWASSTNMMRFLRS